MSIWAFSCWPRTRSLAIPSVFITCFGSQKRLRKIWASAYPSDGYYPVEPQDPQNRCDGKTPGHSGFARPHQSEPLLNLTLSVFPTISRLIASPTHVSEPAGAGRYADGRESPAQRVTRARAHGLSAIIPDRFAHIAGLMPMDKLAGMAAATPAKPILALLRYPGLRGYNRKCPTHPPRQNRFSG